MLSYVEMVLLVGVAGFLFLPIWWAWRLVLVYLLRPADPPLEADQLPCVAVILPLRGSDPSLLTCLRRLLDQDYPHYRVRIIIDSATDPAWEVVHQALAEGHAAGVEVRAETMRQPCRTCSLKISAQMQAIASLPADVEVVAFLDADAIPARDWLRTLVAPFADPRVGCVSGVRWFAPTEPTWGALTRHVWNAGSQTQTYAFGIPWGGTFALRATLFRQGDLLANWRRSFCDDTSVVDCLKRTGLKMRVLPALTLFNHEAIDLVACVRFIRRQMLCPRQDLSRWPVIVAANAAVVLALGTALTLTVAGLLFAQLSWTVWFGSILTGHLVGMTSGLLIAEVLVRRTVGSAGQPPPLCLSWKLLVTPLLAQAISACCFLSALRARRVCWRGVEYRLDGPGQLSMLEYRPFQPDRLSADQSIG